MLMTHMEGHLSRLPRKQRRVMEGGAADPGAYPCGASNGVEEKKKLIFCIIALSTAQLKLGI